MFSAYQLIDQHIYGMSLLSRTFRIPLLHIMFRQFNLYDSPSGLSTHSILRFREHQNTQLPRSHRISSVLVN